MTDEEYEALPPEKRAALQKTIDGIEAVQAALNKDEPCKNRISTLIAAIYYEIRDEGDDDPLLWESVATAARANLKRLAGSSRGRPH